VAIAIPTLSVAPGSALDPLDDDELQAAATRTAIDAMMIPASDRVLGIVGSGVRVLLVNDGIGVGCLDLAAG
jgi:hypothetical protein